MLCFLSFAAKAGFEVQAYLDEAVGEMKTNDAGKRFTTFQVANGCKRPCHRISTLLPSTFLGGPTWKDNAGRLPSFGPRRHRSPGDRLRLTGTEVTVLEGRLIQGRKVQGRNGTYDRRLTRMDAQLATER